MHSLTNTLWTKDICAWQFCSLIFIIFNNSFWRIRIRNSEKIHSFWRTHVDIVRKKKEKNQRYKLNRTDLFLNKPEKDHSGTKTRSDCSCGGSGFRMISIRMAVVRFLYTFLCDHPLLLIQKLYCILECLAGFL